MYQYQEIGRFFAQVAGGIETEGARELTELGATNTETAYRGVYFDADLDTLYRCNYASRVVTRVLAPLVTFDCHSDRYLYRTARDIDWSDFIDSDDSLCVFANVSNSHIRHSQYAALRLKDAVVDQFRDRSGRRPSVDRRSADLWLNLHIENNRAVISIDTSAGSLHRRGYRRQTGEAPLQETVAATMVRWSEWDRRRPLADPMCGSGTIVAEALMTATKTPAGYLRKRFGFYRLPGFDESRWRAVKRQLDSAIVDIPKDLISASDVDAAAVERTRVNLSALPSGERVRAQQADFRKLTGFTDAVLICNPPYGMRMGADDDLGDFYRSLGDFLKQKCTGCTAFVYFGERSWIKSVGLRPTFKRPLANGPLDGRLVRYDLY